MKKMLFILILLFSLSACNDAKKPDDVLDRNTYKQVLKEVVMVNVIRNQKKVKDSFHFNLLQLVYNKYHLDSLSMKVNSDYYARHPEILKEIYKEIKNEYQFQLDSVEKTDSINRKHINIKSKKKFDSITIPTNILA